MSSRSLATARARRAGENAPPVSGNRPGTSIGSHAAFAPQMTAPPQNVRVGRPPQQNAYQPQQQNAYQSQQQTQNAYQPPQQNAYQPPQQNAYQQVQQSQQQTQNGMPFNKLSIADAIGLITLRLGRCEQWIIETEHENEDGTTGVSGIPENARIIDNSILTNFVSRLDSLEKREPGTNTGSNISSIDSELVSTLAQDVSKMNEHLAKIVEEASKHTLITSKHTEQLFRFERELVETKDILKTFMMRYDLFTTETNEKLSDFEFVITELEKNSPDNEEEDKDKDKEEDKEKESDDDDDSEDNTESDLKSIVRKELAAEK